MRLRITTAVLLVLGLALACLPGAVAAADAEYQLGPQDKIAVTVSRHPELEKSYVVPPDGVIEFLRIGRITVSGKTIAQLSQEIKEKLEASGIRAPDVSLLLTEARQRRAHVLGAVGKPGQYTFNAGDRITELLAAAGGVTDPLPEVTASLMRGPKLLPIDLQAALDGTRPEANMPLEEGDVLWVQPLTKHTVVVSGLVKSPGVLKMRPGTRFLDALAAAGDISAAKEDVIVTLMRDGKIAPIDLNKALVGADPNANPELRDNDLFWVQPTTRLTVLVSGQVRTPGAYKLKDGTRFVDALVAAGDVTGDPKELTATLVRGQQVLPIDLQAARAGTDPNANPALYEGDVLWFQSVNKLTTVISGQVKTPGAYKLKDGSTILDALAAVGATADSTDLVVTLMRANETTSMGLQAALHGQAPEAKTPLKDGDVIWIQPLTKLTVIVSGQVKAPGSYRVRAGSTVLDALAASGDVSTALDEVTISLMRGTTMVAIDLAAAKRGTDPKANPALQEGDVIWVQPVNRLNILVSGQVKTSGSYKLKDASTVVDAIVAAGGLMGDTKELTASLVRGTQVIPADLTAAFAGRDPNANLRLQEGDALWIQSRNVLTVIVSGQVRSPGAVRLKEGSNVLDALAAAQGTTNEATDLVITIMRGNETSSMSLQGALNGTERKAKEAMQDGDVVWIQPLTKVTVVVSGQVKSPGSFRLRAGSTALDALAAAGDISVAPEEVVAVLMRGPKAIPVDLKAALAQPEKNPQVQEGDVLWVQPLTKMTVLVSGTVKTPGSFKFKDGATIMDALAAAGGITDLPAELVAALVRGNQNIPLNLPAILGGVDLTANQKLQDGDVIWIQPLTKLTTVVSGQVRTPGAYKLKTGAALTDALAAAGGITGDDRDLTATLMRGNETLPVNLQAALAGVDRNANIRLQDGDVLWIQPLTRYNVVVAGQVKAAGALRLKAGSTFMDALAAAGGLADIREETVATLVRGAKSQRVDLTAALVDPGQNPVLQEGDVLWLQPAEKITVVASGQVRNPGVLKLKVGATFSDALAAAGYITTAADEVIASIMRGKDSITVNLMAALAGADRNANPVLQEGDVLWVQPVDKISVVVAGQVKNPGSFKLRPNSTLIDALVAAGDVVGRKDKVKVTLLRGTTRQDVDLQRPLQVLDADTLLVEPLPVCRVYINGHVRTPGVYELEENATVLRAIALAGGVLDRPALDQITIVRAATNQTEQVNLLEAFAGNVGPDPKLQSGDQVMIPQSTTSVAVFGYVSKPGQFPVNISKPLTITEAIANAGGLDKDSNGKEVRVIRTQKDGKQVSIKVNVDAILAKNPAPNFTLQPSDIVYVPKKGGVDWKGVLDSLYRVGVIVSVIP